MNRSDSERFEAAYQTLWRALHRADDPDLSQHERQLLHHVPAEGGVTLTWLAGHLALPKSSASVLVKDLERRGFVRRTRDEGDQRRLAIVLTDEGRKRVETDTVLDPAALAEALGRLEPTLRRALLYGLDRLTEILAWQPSRPNEPRPGSDPGRG